MAPDKDISAVAEAHSCLLNVIGGLSNADVRRASLLPGWSVGHVLTHVARNADSHARRAKGAARGEMVDQYEGGYEGRAADIELGSARSVDELIEDVTVSAALCENAWRDVQPEAWSVVSRDVGGLERPLFDLPARRWQEVEVHLVDIDVGFTHDDWPDDFVAEWLPRAREKMSGSLAPELRAARFGSGAEELAWLYGRLRRPDLPQPPPWG